MKKIWNQNPLSNIILIGITVTLLTFVFFEYTMFGNDFSLRGKVDMSLLALFFAPLSQAAINKYQNQFKGEAFNWNEVWFSMLGVPLGYWLLIIYLNNELSVIWLIGFILGSIGLGLLIRRYPYYIK